ncbi:MAG: hypothetical protein ACLSE6_05305 [Alphaproteobacteria bacterium]
MKLKTGRRVDFAAPTAQKGRHFFKTGRFYFVALGGAESRRTCSLHIGRIIVVDAGYVFE